MRDVGIFYQTKRGEDIPIAYKSRELHSDIAEIGKLCLSGVFQMSCLSRNKPSTIYFPEYYDYIFNGNQQQIAKRYKELLYIDCYFRTTFIRSYVKDITDTPNSEIKVQFANNARTVCTAYVMFASRYYQKNLNFLELNKLFKVA